MYTLKQIPEDFIVTEISNVELNQNGPYSYFWLKKRNKNTLEVIKELAQKLGIREKEIGFAGSKDKQAVTEQLISFQKIKREKIENLKLNRAELQFYGYGNRPITLGDLVGNQFSITIRDLTTEKIPKINFVENYFDEQRFSENNVAIGRHLLKKELAAAVELIDQPIVREYLEQKPNDYIGALKRIPMRLLKMYGHAYQSYLWNETLAAYLREKYQGKELNYSLGKLFFSQQKEELDVPLVGFGQEIENKNLKKIIDKILKKEQLSETDFIFKPIPELSLEGGLRTAFAAVKSLKIGKIELDELNSGQKKCLISFTLDKGSYATMVIKKLLIK